MRVLSSCSLGATHKGVRWYVPANVFVWCLVGAFFLLGNRVLLTPSHRSRLQGGARNTESFDPKSTLVRPEMRIIIGPNRETYVDKGKGGPSTRPIKHDDVIIVPEFFCKEDDWSLYYTLIEEMRAAQADGKPKADWKPWAEGAHLITDNPTHSKTYQMIQRKISTYFGINNEKVGTRFNWYTDRFGCLVKPCHPPPVHWEFHGATPGGSHHRQSMAKQSHMCPGADVRDAMGRVRSSGRLGDSEGA